MQYLNYFQTRQSPKNSAISYETCPLFPEDKLICAFTNRFGGVSSGPQASLNLDHKKDTAANVRQNHLLLAAALDYPAEAMVSTRQIHSDIIRIARPEDAGLHLLGPVPYECDALITDEPGRPLIAYAADCIPILLWAPKAAGGAAIAAIHAGWRGTCADIAAKCVRKMAETYGIQPADCRAAIGPGIGPCCFSTHDDVPQAFLQAFGEPVRSFIRPDSQNPGKFLPDLKAINGWRLEQAGLSHQNIAISPECTCCLPNKYWSHRFTKGERGGQAAIIMLK